MILNLNDQYRLRTLDSRNVVLEEKKVATTDNIEYWKPLTYHGHFGDALASCLDDPRFLTTIKDRTEHYGWMNKIMELNIKILAEWDEKEI